MQNFFPGYLTLILLFGSNLLILSQYHTFTNLSLTAYTINNLPAFKTVQFFITILIPANLLKLSLSPLSCHLLPSLPFGLYFSLLSFFPIPFSPSPHIGSLSISWNEIQHPHRPALTSDLLWKISHHSLPVGISVSKSLPLVYHVPGVPQPLIPYLISSTLVFMHLKSG